MGGSAARTWRLLRTLGLGQWLLQGRSHFPSTPKLLGSKDGPQDTASGYPKMCLWVGMEAVLQSSQKRVGRTQGDTPAPRTVRGHVDEVRLAFQYGRSITIQRTWPSCV